MRKLSAYLPTITQVTSLLIFISFCLFYMNSIPLIYDEAQFINVALGEITKGVTYKKLFGMPFMLLPDQGAVKSFLYYPLFKLFRVSVTTVRLPAILLSTLTLYIWYKLIKQIVPRKLALLFLLLLSTDQFFIFSSTIDYGPIVIQNFLIVTILYFYFQSLNKNTFRNLSIVCAALTLGTLNKLNFIWFVFAFFGAALLYDRKHLLNLLKNHAKKYSLLGIIFITSMLLISKYLILPAITNFPMAKMLHAPLSTKIIFTLNLYLSSFNSSYNYSDLFNNQIGIPSMINVFEITCLFIWLIGVIFKIGSDRTTKINQSILFFLMLYLFETILIFFTPHTYAPNHIIILWPLPHVLSFLMAISIAQALSKKPMIQAALPVGLTSILIISQLYVNYEFIIAFMKTEHYANAMWSPAILNLSEYINDHASEFDHILSIDWGSNNSIFALANDNSARNKFYELSAAFTDNPMYIQIAATIAPDFFSGSPSHIHEKIYNAFFKGKNTLIIFYTNNEMMHGVKRNFLSFCFDHHLQITPSTVIRDNAGEAIFNVYAVQG